MVPGAIKAARQARAQPCLAPPSARRRPPPAAARRRSATLAIPTPLRAQHGGAEDRTKEVIDLVGAVKRIIRVLFIRSLGACAVPILAVIGLLGRIRRARTSDVQAVDPKTGRVKLRGERGWR